jgi:hypothetical protein
LKILNPTHLFHHLREMLQMTQQEEVPVMEPLAARILLCKVERVSQL